jgi:hypothetical protein
VGLYEFECMNAFLGLMLFKGLTKSHVYYNASWSNKLSAQIPVFVLMNIQLLRVCCHLAFISSVSIVEHLVPDSYSICLHHNWVMWYEQKDEVGCTLVFCIFMSSDVKHTSLNIPLANWVIPTKIGSYEKITRSIIYHCKWFYFCNS